MTRPEPAVAALRSGVDWISLGPAARLLGVDPATLRRWSSSGRIEAFTTPGGHRRFSRSAIERLREEQAAGSMPLGASPRRIAAAYRRRYGGARPPLPRPWLADLAETDRDGFRARGLRMVDAILARLDAADAGARSTSLRTAERIGREYGAEARRLDLSLADAIAAFLGSREPLLVEIATLASRRGLTVASSGRLFTEAAALLDDVLLALIAEYEAGTAGRARASRAAAERRRGAAQAAEDTMSVLVPAVTSVIALTFAVLLIDQWRVRRRTFQAVWAAGMLFFGLASACEAIGAAAGWNEALYRTWYLTGAMWTAGWLGLGTAFLLGRTRFGYAFAASLLLAGVFTLLTQRRYDYPGAGSAPIAYLIAAVILAAAIAVETYFANERWPRLAALAVGGVTVVSVALMLTTTLPPPGYALLPSGLPDPVLFPGTLRLLTPFMNITGGLALALGALFSAYVFMPKRRVLDYSLDPAQKGDEFLFNMAIACVAIPVNFIASLPGAIRAQFAGRLHSRVLATLLIAIGGFLAAGPDLLSRFGVADYMGIGKLLAVVFLFAGFLVSIDAFAEFRVPFTAIVLRRRHEPVEAAAATLEPG